MILKDLLFFFYLKTDYLLVISVTNENMNVVPWPNLEFTSMLPFNFSAIRLQILNPSPWLFLFFSRLYIS